MGERLFFSKLITKDLSAVESDRRLFEGVLTVEMKDKQGEITVRDELLKVLPIWIARGGPITDTHSNRVVGKGINYASTTVTDSDGTQFPAITIQGEIFKDYQLDDEIWKSIKNGKYKGLSFGGATKTGRTPTVEKDGSIAYALKDLEQYEVAVCEEPAVPLALITQHNDIAKAMAGNTTDRGNGKMCIRCDKFKCYIEKKEPIIAAEDTPSHQKPGKIAGNEEQDAVIDGKISPSKVHGSLMPCPAADSQNASEFGHQFNNRHGGGKISREGQKEISYDENMADKWKTGEPLSDVTGSNKPEHRDEQSEAFKEKEAPTNEELENNRGEPQENGSTYHGTSKNNGGSSLIEGKDRELREDTIDQDVLKDAVDGKQGVDKLPLDNKPILNEAKETIDRDTRGQNNDMYKNMSEIDREKFKGRHSKDDAVYSRKEQIGVCEPPSTDKIKDGGDGGAVTTGTEGTNNPVNSGPTKRQKELMAEIANEKKEDPMVYDGKAQDEDNKEALEDAGLEEEKKLEHVSGHPEGPERKKTATILKMLVLTLELKKKALAKGFGDDDDYNPNRAKPTIGRQYTETIEDKETGKKIPAKVVNIITGKKERIPKWVRAQSNKKPVKTNPRSRYSSQSGRAHNMTTEVKPREHQDKIPNTKRIATEEQRARRMAARRKRTDVQNKLKMLEMAFELMKVEGCGSTWSEPGNGNFGREPGVTRDDESKSPQAKIQPKHVSEPVNEEGAEGLKKTKLLEHSREFESSGKLTSNQQNKLNHKREELGVKTGDIPSSKVGRRQTGNQHANSIGEHDGRSWSAADAHTMGKLDPDLASKLKTVEELIKFDRGMAANNAEGGKKDNLRTNIDELAEAFTDKSTNIADPGHGDGGVRTGASYDNAQQSTGEQQPRKVIQEKCTSCWDDNANGNDNEEYEK